MLSRKKKKMRQRAHDFVEEKKILHTTKSCVTATFEKHPFGLATIELSSAVGARYDCRMCTTFFFCNTTPRFLGGQDMSLNMSFLTQKLILDEHKTCFVYRGRKIPSGPRGTYNENLAQQKTKRPIIYLFSDDFGLLRSPPVIQKTLQFYTKTATLIIVARASCLISPQPSRYSPFHVVRWLLED